MSFVRKFDTPNHRVVLGFAPPSTSVEPSPTEGVQHFQMGFFQWLGTYGGGLKDPRNWTNPIGVNLATATHHYPRKRSTSPAIDAIGPFNPNASDPRVFEVVQEKEEDKEEIQLDLMSEADLGERFVFDTCAEIVPTAFTFSWLSRAVGNKNYPIANYCLQVRKEGWWCWLSG